MVSTFSFGVTPEQGSVVHAHPPSERLQISKSFKSFLKRQTLVVLFLGLFTVPSGWAKATASKTKKLAKVTVVNSRKAIDSLVRVIDSITITAKQSKHELEELKRKNDENDECYRNIKNNIINFPYSNIIIAFFTFLGVYFGFRTARYVYLSKKDGDENES